MSKTEKDIIFIIKYLPITLVIFVSIIVTYHLYLDLEQNFINDYGILETQKILAEENIKKESLNKLFLTSVLFTSIVCFILIYIASVLEDKFLIYKIEVKNEIDNKRKIESLEKINKQIKDFSTALYDFRELFQNETKPNIFNLDETINKLLEFVESQLKKENIEIIRNTHSIDIKSLENELIQVLINLINNAREKLMNSNDKRIIFINLKKVKNNVVISIKDNAGGIDLNNIDNIFNAYFSTKDSRNSDGIGLFVSEKIIKEHLHGDIIAKNSTYKYTNKIYTGAEFKVILPLN